jgi:hypothetical protein
MAWIPRSSWLKPCQMTDAAVTTVVVGYTAYQLYRIWSSFFHRSLPSATSNTQQLPPKPPETEVYYQARPVAREEKLPLRVSSPPPSSRTAAEAVMNDSLESLSSPASNALKAKTADLRAQSSLSKNEILHNASEMIYEEVE